MSFGAVAGITLAIAVVLVMGVGLMSYVSTLIKNAYQIKVELRSDVDTAIARMEAEMDRRGKALRKELADDAGQLRDAVKTENERRLKEIEDRLQAASKDLQEAARGDKMAVQKVLSDLQTRLKALETDMAAVKGELARRAALARSLRDKDRADVAEAAIEAESPVAANAPAVSAASLAAAPLQPTAAPAPTPAPALTTGNPRFQYDDFAAG
ncbi:hypothetical protein ACM64Y_08175 [Novispirillum sp. DQ9]|uniref:hypothetical protein n=1 Tax=Novispirillum sp. DQ9 TaxID=3398612 RepID=UPI003C7E9201